MPFLYNVSISRHPVGRYRCVQYHPLSNGLWVYIYVVVLIQSILERKSKYHMNYCPVEFLHFRFV